MPRRFAARVLIAVILALPIGSAWAQPTKLRFTLDWRFEGQLAMFMLAKNRGYFEREGLDVQVDVGTGSAASINRLPIADTS